MIYKLSLTILLLATSFTTETTGETVSLDCFDAEGITLLVNPDHIKSKHSVGLLCDHEGFIVRRGDDYIRVNSYDIDDLFLSMTLKQIAEYSANNQFKVIQLLNGEYKVEAYGELKGGGIGGATAGVYAGKLIVSFLGHGTLLVISGFAGPAQPAALFALESTFGAAIEVASTSAAIGCGIAAGVVTGPV